MGKEEIRTWQQSYGNGKVVLTGYYSFSSLFQKIFSGLWKQFYKNNKLKISGNIINGKRVGLWVFYALSEEKENEIRFYL